MSLMELSPEAQSIRDEIYYAYDGLTEEQRATEQQRDYYKHRVESRSLAAFMLSEWEKSEPHIKR